MSEYIYARMHAGARASGVQRPVDVQGQLLDLDTPILVIVFKY